MIDIPLFQGLALKMGEPPLVRKEYPTTRLQKGLLLLDQDRALDEEGVGFGVPVLKRGLTTIFPGAVELTTRQEDSTWEIHARFKLNLVEKISKGGNGLVENRLAYGVKNLLAALIRQAPIMRSPMTSTSSIVREMFKLETAYAITDFSDVVEVIYRIEGETGKLTIDVDAGNVQPGVTEVVVMNEQGAHSFDRYRDTSGIALQGKNIGCWDEVHAQKAWFESSERKIAFKLSPTKGARLFRGRELIGSRLAWAGFGYTFPPSIKAIRYEMSIERIP